MTLPEGAASRITFEGKQTTERTVLMIKEARRLYKLRGGGSPPKITQGGYSTAVSASAGTHARDALDFGTGLFSSTNSKLWERCVWEVGFASWRRSYIAGVWPAHTHSLPKGGDLSSAARAQIVQWYQGDNALASDRPYPGILSSGLVARTWERYKIIKPHGSVDLSGVVAAFEAGTKQDPSQNFGGDDIEQIQEALNHFLGSILLIDGIPGPATRGVYATYQAREYGVPVGSPSADGIPGRDSLERLGFRVVA